MKLYRYVKHMPGKKQPHPSLIISIKGEGLVGIDAPSISAKCNGATPCIAPDTSRD
ncbi:MAG: hypothetical protein Q9167_007892 [Letrouitia subvulpina]